MFRYEGFDYSLDQVTDAASKKGLSVDEYVDQFGLETVEVQTKYKQPQLRERQTVLWEWMRL